MALTLELGELEVESFVTDEELDQILNDSTLTPQTFCPDCGGNPDTETDCGTDLCTEGCLKPSSVSGDIHCCG